MWHTPHAIEIDLHRDLQTLTLTLSLARCVPCNGGVLEYGTVTADKPYP